MGTGGSFCCKLGGYKWIFKRNLKVDGSGKYKARLILKGCKQKKYVEHFDTYPPVLNIFLFTLFIHMGD